MQIIIQVKLNINTAVKPAIFPPVPFALSTLDYNNVVLA